MKITLLTVGKTDVRWVREGLELYASRLSHYVKFSIREIPELKNVSAFTREQIKEKEGEEKEAGGGNGVKRGLGLLFFFFLRY